jgi:Protein of unknown function (DUF2971)
MRKIGIDESSMPDIIYKYRTWSNDEHKRMITKREVYFCSPLKMQSDYELYFDIDMWQYFYDYAPMANIFDHEDRVHFADENFSQKKEIIDAQKDKIRHILNKETTVFCASELSNNEKLWSDFAYSGRGFCVGLNLREIMKNLPTSSSAQKVIYCEKPPLIKAVATDDDKIERFLTCLFSLNIKFEKEKEIRLVKINIESKKNILPEGCFKEIILGYDISNEDKREILDSVKSNFQFIKVKKAIKTKEGLEFEEINSFITE